MIICGIFDAYNKYDDDDDDDNEHPLQGKYRYFYAW